MRAPSASVSRRYLFVSPFCGPPSPDREALPRPKTASSARTSSTPTEPNGWRLLRRRRRVQLCAASMATAAAPGVVLCVADSCPRSDRRRPRAPDWRCSQPAAEGDKSRAAPWSSAASAGSMTSIPIAEDALEPLRPGYPGLRGDSVIACATYYRLRDLYASSTVAANAQINTVSEKPSRTSPAINIGDASWINIEASASLPQPTR